MTAFSSGVIIRNVSQLVDVLAAFARVPWFSRLGQPLVADNGASLMFPPWEGLPKDLPNPWTAPLWEEGFEDVERLPSLDEWPGPEDEFSVELSEDFNRNYRMLVEQAGWLRRGRRRSTYDRVRSRVIEIAGPKFPGYIDGADAWHAPNCAAYNAGSVAALMTVAWEANVAPPQSLAAEWEWYRHGHWPASVSTLCAWYPESPSFCIY